MDSSCSSGFRDSYSYSYSLLPALGVMQFDSADLLRIETDGSLENVTFYEMGHLLGVGTL
jgi:hypothetical protein